MKTRNLAVAALAAWMCPAAYAQDPTEGEAKAAVEKVLARYEAALEARSVERMAEVMDPEVVVLEGIHKNMGWADYRDKHIGPEMKEWESLRIDGAALLTLDVSGDLAAAVRESVFTMKTAEGVITLQAAETFVFRKASGAWKIRHIHFSGKRLDNALKKRRRRPDPQ